MEHAEFDAWFESLPAGDHPRDGKEWALEGWKAAKDTVLASEGQAVKPVAWLIDWPDEPELGHYFAEKPVDPLYGRSKPLYTHPSAELAALRERIAGIEKDASRYQWLRSEHFPTADKPPLALVMWKCRDDRRSSEWVNMIDGNDLDDQIDQAIEESK